MPTKIEKDSVTGRETTGHEWDGIKELNTPLPKWWVYTFYASIIWSLAYFVLYPAIPLWDSYTKGVLDWNSRDELGARLEQAAARQATYLDRIRDASLADIQGDQQLLNFALAGGGAAFADNCAPCHGQGGAGRPGGFPVLADDSWIWGGTPEAIQQTLRHGIRWEDDPDTRFNEMPAFGDGLLEPAQIADVASYVLSLSGRAEDAEAAARGGEVFAEQCAACHGEEGEGLQELGGPRLSDGIWLYGGERADIIAQINRPKHGVMPAWQGRLAPETIKMLTVYVHSLGGGE